MAARSGSECGALFRQLHILEGLSPVLELRIAARKQGIDESIIGREFLRSLQFADRVMVTPLGVQRTRQCQFEFRVIGSEFQSRAVFTGRFR